MPIDIKALVAQADYALTEYKKLRATSQHEDCSDNDDVEIARVVALVAATIERLAPPASHYQKTTAALMQKFGASSAYPLRSLPGVLRAVREDLAAGRMQTVAEMIHGDMFGDMLEGAAYLREDGWKDPAAVIAGSVLEQHLRGLCAKHEIATSKPDGKPKKADTLNAELAAAGAYSGLDQKLVTAWLGLRNKAAHGEYAAYETMQVATMIDGIRDFISRCPA